MKKTTALILPALFATALASCSGSKVVKIEEFIAEASKVTEKGVPIHQEVNYKFSVDDGKQQIKYEGKFAVDAANNAKFTNLEGELEASGNAYTYMMAFPLGGYLRQLEKDDKNEEINVTCYLPFAFVSTFAEGSMKMSWDEYGALINFHSEQKKDGSTIITDYSYTYSGTFSYIAK